MIDEKTYKKLQWFGTTDNLIKVKDGYYVEDIQSVIEDLIYVIDAIEEARRDLELMIEENFYQQKTKKDGETNDKYNNNDNSMHDNIDACNNRER